MKDVDFTLTFGVIQIESRMKAKNSAKKTEGINFWNKFGNYYF